MDIEEEPAKKTVKEVKSSGSSVSGVEISECLDLEEGAGDGSEGVVSPATTAATEEAPSTMGDEEVACRKQASDDHDHSEAYREGPGGGHDDGNNHPIIHEPDSPCEDEDDDVFAPTKTTPKTIESNKGVQNQRGRKTKIYKNNKILSTVPEEFNHGDGEEEADEEEGFDNNDNFGENYGAGENWRKRNRKDKGSTKIVIRRLPPKMRRKEFIEAISPLPDYDYLVIDNPDSEWGPNARSVAHINFLDDTSAMWFVERFNRYQFLSEEGEIYVALCDFAMISRVFHPLANKRNTRRGTLDQSEEYLAFLEKYEENPFQFAVGLPPKENLTTAMMLEEIEKRPKKMGAALTPLLDFINKKKERREADRKASREREREMRERNRLDRLRRDKERRENNQNNDGRGEGQNREQRRAERRREKRERERKDRRERERLEREQKLGQKGSGPGAPVKSGGMTVTYSKSGKVTRWSANSSPLIPKPEELNITNKEIKGNEPSASTEKKESGSQDIKSIPKLMKNPIEKPPELMKKNLPDLRKFSKEFSTPSKDKEEKSKFGKPFPNSSIKKNPPTTSDSTRTNNEDKDKPKESGGASASGGGFGGNGGGGGPKRSNNEDRGKPKESGFSGGNGGGPKRSYNGDKDKPKESVGGGASGSGSGGNGSGGPKRFNNGNGDKSSAPAKTTASAPKEGGSGSGSAGGSAEDLVTKIRAALVTGGGGGGDHSERPPEDNGGGGGDKKKVIVKKIIRVRKKKEEGVEGGAGKEISGKEKEVKGAEGGSGGVEEKKRRARPDMQIYRPGSLRKDTKSTPKS